MLAEDDHARKLLADVPPDSLVTVSGSLRQEKWRVGDGSERECLLLVLGNLVLLYDARRARMRF